MNKICFLSVVEKNSARLSYFICNRSKEYDLKGIDNNTKKLVFD